PRLRSQVLEDLERVGLKAWSVRNSCPIEQLDSYEFELADHVIVTERLNRGELPEFERYKLPSWRPWEFVGIVPETGYNPPKPSWRDHPPQTGIPTRRRHNGRPVFEPVVCVRLTYNALVPVLRVDARLLY